MGWRDGSTVAAYRRPLGYQQITSITSATALTLPTPLANSGLVPTYAIIQCEGSSSVARWRDDGTDPSSTVGMQLASGQELDYSGDLTMIKFIDGTSTSKLNISYYA